MYGKKNDALPGYFRIFSSPYRRDHRCCVMHLYKSLGNRSYRVVSMSRAAIEIVVTTHTRGGARTWGFTRGKRNGRSER